MTFSYTKNFSSALGKPGCYPKLLALILVVAAAIRIWHVLALNHLPLFDNLLLDSKLYDDWAMRIANGNWLGGDRAYYMDPLYSYLLAVQYWIFGHNLLLVRLLQAVFGVATCLLVANIGRRIGGDSVGLLSALLAALYQPLVFEGGEIEKTAIGVLLVTASLNCAIGKSTVSKFAAGALLATASLCRGNLLLLAPLGAVYFLVFGESGSLASAKGIKEWLQTHLLAKPARDALAFVLGFLLMLSPVLLRNHYVSGEWILTTSQMGENFYTGNNPSSSSGGYNKVQFVRPSPEYEEYDFHTMAEKLTGNKLSAKQVSSFWFHKSLEHIGDNPAFAAKVFMRKIVLFWGDREVADGWSLYFIKKYSPALSLSVITFGWIFPLALIGTVVSFRRVREVRLLLGFVLAYFISVIAFFIFSRYRIFVVPPLFILAALGLKWMLERLQEADWRKLMPGCLAVLAAAGFSFSAATIAGHNIFDSSYSLMAKQYIAMKDYKSAEALLKEGLELEPRSASNLEALGLVRSKTGDLEGAVESFVHCLESDPEFPNAWYNLGFVYFKLGKYQEAIRCYEKQLEIVPGHQAASNNLQYMLSLPSGSITPGAPLH